MTTDHFDADHIVHELARVLGSSLGALLHTNVSGLHPGRGFTGDGLGCLPKHLRISNMALEYERINATAMARKSADQLRKWRVTRTTSIDTFINALGVDCLVRELTLHHAHVYHRYWQQRVLNGEIRINSANRLMRNLSGLYSTIHNHYRLECRNPFAGLNLRGGCDGKRLAYSAGFVRDRFLADGAFDTLNPEARRIVFLVVETGLRPSEACGLDRSTINLEGPIPFVRVADDIRQTKTPGSVRTVPLVGVALTAMRLQPDGFPRYRNRADVASATINKALTAKNLRPGGKMQSLYSLRHTLIDRLRTAEAPKDIQEDILGHIHMYGEGTSLEHRHAWLQRIAFKEPAHI